MQEQQAMKQASFSDLMMAGGLAARDEQSKFALMVEQALTQTGKISLIHADTGIGKSLGYLLTAIQKALTDPRRPRVLVCTHSHALMNQLLGKDCDIVRKVARAYDLPPPSVGRLLGRMNYVSPERVDQAVIGRSLSSLDKREVANLRDWNGTIAEFEDEFGGLPCSLLASQICRTGDCEAEEFSAAHRAEMACDIVVTTHAMLAIDMLRNHALLADPDRPCFLIVDEADALASQLEEWTQRRLNLVRVLGQLAEYVSRRHLAPLEARINEIQQLLGRQHYAWDRELSAIASDTLTMINELSHRRDLDVDVAAALQRQVLTVTSSTIGLGVSLERREPAVVALNPWFAKNFGRYASTHYDATLLTSGTLSITPEPVNGTMWIRVDLGIEESMLGVLEHFSPQHYGHLSLSLAGPDFPAIYERGRGVDEAPTLSVSWLESVAHVISQRPGRVVVLTASHDESAKLAKLLESIEHRTVLLHQRDIPLKQMVSEFQQVCERHNGCVLLTAAGHTGLNIVDSSGAVGFDRLVITRITYGQPRTAEMDALVDYYKTVKHRDLSKILYRNAYIRTANTAIRQMRQALGRGIRSPSDTMAVDMCDPRFPLADDLSSRYANLRNIIPHRFMVQYQQAGSLIESSEEAQSPLMEIYF
ncbi:helicase C-terminal domain-containing protein [Aeromonas caviae]